MNAILSGWPLTGATALFPCLSGLGLEVLPGLLGGRDSGVLRLLPGSGGLGMARLGQQA